MEISRDLILITNEGLCHQIPRGKGQLEVQYLYILATNSGKYTCILLQHVCLVCLVQRLPDNYVCATICHNEACIGIKAYAKAKVGARRV